SAREIFQKDIPSFPRFAKRKGVGTTITLQFTVLPNGQVRENTAVVRTSGSAAWDDVVIRSLKRWRFTPLADGVRQDQTGTITFQFVID
ncbi:energy transducer TonB, partial [bacterium]|nr:energy transducer TonB [bacterium]